MKMLFFSCCNWLAYFVYLNRTKKKKAQTSFFFFFFKTSNLYFYLTRHQHVNQSLLPRKVILLLTDGKCQDLKFTFGLGAQQLLLLNLVAHAGNRSTSLAEQTKIIISLKMRPSAKLNKMGKKKIGLVFHQLNTASSLRFYVNYTEGNFQGLSRVLSDDE